MILTVNLRLHIAPEQMYCANCSRTIRSCIDAFLTAKHLDFSYISTDYRKKTVEIANLTLQDEQTLADIFKLLAAELETIGYDCTQYENINAPLAIQATNPVLPPPAVSELIQSIPPLSLGAGLMLVEHMCWLPKLSAANGLSINLSVGIAATLISGYLGQNHFKNAWRTRGAMDTLISLGTLTAITYSFLLIAQPAFLADEDVSLSFSLPLMIFGFLKLSHGLRDLIHAHIEAQMDCLDALTRKLPYVAQTYLVNGEQHDELMRLLLQPTIEQDFIPFANQLEQLPVNKLRIGSILCVEKNAIVPVDAFLLGIQTIAVREEFYGKKGETIKHPGDEIFAGAENTSGGRIFLSSFCLAKDNHLTKSYASFKAENSTDASLELVSHYFLRGVLSIALMSALGWGIFGPQPAISNAIRVFMAALLSACPCGLGLIGINASMIKSLALGTGILIQKNTIFNIDQATDVCFDKCGTLTTGNYALEKIVSADGLAFDLHIENTYLAHAMLLEQAISNDNPTTIASAIIQQGKKRQLDLSTYTLSTFSDNLSNKGRGGTAVINGNQTVVGNKVFLAEQGIVVAASWLALAKHWAQHNRLAIFFAIDAEVRCLLILQSAEELYPVLRPGVKAAIEWLIQQGKTIHILTGDNEDRTQLIVQQLNINHPIIIRCEQKPQDKINYVSQLTQAIMLGDDANDLGAMQHAAYGLAIDTLAPIRGEADAVLNGTFMALVQLMCLAKTYRQSYFCSLLIVFGINGVSLLAAAGLFYPLTQQFVDPMITGMAMVGSSLLLLTNIAVFKCLGTNRLAAIKQSLSHTAPATSGNALSSFEKRLANNSSHSDVLQPLLSLSSCEQSSYRLDGIV